MANDDLRISSATVASAITASAIVPGVNAAGANVGFLGSAFVKMGNWTPGIEFGGGSTGLTLSTNDGKYIKSANHIIAAGRITFSAKGSSTGEARITGLPEVAAPTGPSAAAGQIMAVYFSNMSGMQYGLTGYIIGNETEFRLRTFGVSANVATVDEGYFTDSTDLAFRIMYATAWS
jgi:hypothetical protein